MTKTIYKMISTAAIVAAALSGGLAQITIQGKTTVSGSIEVNYPYTHNVQIMAFSPPSYGTPDYNNFLANVDDST
jgi:hypothetical protein